MHPDVDTAHPVTPAQRPVPGPPPGGSADRDTIVARMEQSVAALDALGGLPVAEHVPRFEAAHAALTEALSSIDKV